MAEEVWILFSDAAEIVRGWRGLVSPGDAIDLLEVAVSRQRVACRGTVSNGNSLRRQVLDYVPELHPERYKLFVNDYREIEQGSLHRWLRSLEQSATTKAAPAGGDRIEFDKSGKVGRSREARDAAIAILRSLPASSVRQKRLALLADVNAVLEPKGMRIEIDTLRRALKES
jgi:hypothetical protein